MSGFIPDTKWYWTFCCEFVVLVALLSIATRADAIITTGPATPARNTAAAVLPADQTIAIKTPREVAKGQFTIVAPSRRWAELTLSAQPLKFGNYAASIRFPNVSGASRIQLDDARLGCKVDSPCSIDFEIIDAKARGTYVGKVDLDASTEHLATATINLLVPDGGPPPVPASDFLKGNTLDFDATKDDSFFLSVTNAAASPSRELKFVAVPGSGIVATSLLDRLHPAPPCVATSSGVPVEFYPPSALLDAGATQEIRVQVPGCLGPGTYKSVLQVIDADDDLVVASKELKITKAAPEVSRRWALLLWVVFGAALSVALNNAFPLRRARADRFDELSKVKAKLNGCGSIGSALRGALRSEAQRLWLLIDSVTFVNTRKDAILTDAQQGTQALWQLVTVADSINALRAECSGLAQPIRTLLVIASYLREAEDALMRSDVAGAQARVTAATQAARTECDPKALAGSLTADITKLLAERYNGDDVVPAAARTPAACHASRDAAIAKGRPRSIAQRIVLMELNRANLSGQPLADLLTLERDFYIADVWTNIVEIAVANANDGAQKRLKQMEEPLLAQLEIAPAAVHTQLAILLVKSNLSFFDLQSALETQQAQIACNPYARYLDLENFQFQFLSPVLSAVPATTQLLDYRWEFDDRTTPPDDGDRCKHFFWAPSKWQRIRRRIKNDPMPSHTVTVTVKMPLAAPLAQPATPPPETLPAEAAKASSEKTGLGATTPQEKALAVPETHVFTREIAMQVQRDRASSLGAIQIITFCITTGMAVLASFGAQYGGVLPLTIDWGASVTALLFGFGIDQIRDRAASK